jgi:hypothetical protein
MRKEAIQVKRLSTSRDGRFGRRGFLLAILGGGLLELSSRTVNAADDVVFRDADAQARQFMEWERTIRLSPEQEQVKKAALSSIPAPCCSDNSAYTCCCPCNMSRTIWGLANHMIARQGANAREVRAKAEEWIAFINPNGYDGKACYTGRCPRPFREDGCGGMNASHLNL